MDKYKTAYGTGITIDVIEIFHNIMIVYSNDPSYNDIKVYLCSIYRN